MIRVAFIINFEGNSWLGGINYFRNLLLAITTLPGRKIEPVIFTGKKHHPKLFNEFPLVEIVASGLLDRWHPAWVIRKSWYRLSSKDYFLESLLLQNRISVVSHSICFGPGSSIRSVGWIPDFQHLHLPEYFPKKQIKARDNWFINLARGCDLMILSSYCAQRDFCDFAPEYAEKARVLQFVVMPVLSHQATDLQELQNRYDFGSRYFHVPNQFWAHKNHRVILDALKVLKEDGHHISILATGSIEDDRNSQYFYELMAYARQLNVLDCFRVLGLIPYNDMVGLMVNAVAVINPSLWEGWSTTVEEAKSLGLRLILSDIPVHREQAPTKGTFFSPKDGGALARILLEFWQSKSEPDAPGGELPIAVRDRFRAFGEKYQNIVLELHDKGASS